MVFGLFSSKEKNLQKLIGKATNKLAQQADRWAALEKLREDGSEDALFGLCKRFAITSGNMVEDQQEKTWVVDVLVAKGQPVLPPLRRFMKNAAQLSYALQVLERVATKEQALEAVDALLADEPPGYVRDPERKLDVIRWMTEWKAGRPETFDRMLPYVGDFDQNVRVAAVDGIADAEASLVGKPLLDAFLRPEEESGRFRRRVAEVLAAKKIPLGDKASAVTPHLVGPVAGFAVESGVLVQR
ncbi:MAG: hypothetical protein F9K40_20280 [Kofleriaceae bacterium]|nr:MAG: hypothetical protein F9K40_20280 [Kofleriaceae bacterium]MBZ0238932.1 hypothetical protein [Kofleriaceae bacterium]